MSGEFLFELIDKAQWSFDRKVRPNADDKSWPLTNTFRKWFNTSIKLSPNAERFLQQTDEKSSPIGLHLPSNRLALVVNNNICIISLLTSDILLEIPLDVSRSDEYNYLNCLAWSNNGKLLAYGHWSGIVCVYSSNDGQLLHELPTKPLNRGEDSFVEIWFSGSDASQFIDLLCLKRTGELIRYVMSRDDIASCAEEKFDFHISCAIIDSNLNQLYTVPFNTKSILVWKIVDTNPSVIKIKEIIDEESDQVYIYDLALSSDESCLVSILSDQSIVLYQNNQYLRCLAKLKINETRPFICDFDYWDDKTLILFYADGSMSFHEGKETLEEYRYESNQLNQCPRLCRRTSNELYIIDTKITKENDDEIEAENSSNVISRLFRSLKDSTESITERLILIEHSDPDRLIENLISNGEYGEALRVCKVFNRTDLADQIHERELRLSSRQLRVHLTRIQSRLHVLQLSTTLLYPTFDEQLELIQIGLNQATRKILFDNLFYSDKPFYQSIYDENLNLKDVQEKQIPLNIPQKQILLYRRKLLDEKRKLYLYEDLMKISKIFQQYQSNVFQKFREWDYKQIALRCAREGQLNGLKLVIERAFPSLSSIDLLSVLNEIPENLPLSEYEDLIPKFHSIEQEEEEIEIKENDWTDKYVTPSEETKPKADQSLFIEWYNQRISSFESFGFIENALQLCKHAYEIEEFEEFRSFYNILYLELLLNKSSDQDLTLKQIQQMSEEDIIDSILTFKSDSNQDDIDKRIQLILIPSMDLIKQSNEYLKRNLIKKLQNNFDIYPIIRSLKFQTIFNKNSFDQLIKDLILNVNSINQISTSQQLLTLINDKQDLEYIIESCRIFIKWSVRMIPSEMIRIIESEESLSNAIILLIQSAIKEQMNTMNISTGNELYHDIEQICRNRLSSQTLSNLFVSSLLKSDSIECFQIVRSMLSRSHIPLIIQAATDYIDSAKNGQDKSILLAKHCLDLIDDPSLVINERNLIEAQNICDFFQYPITPLEIRRHPNPMQIIPAILNSKAQAYKNTSKLIALALHLQTGNKQDKKARCMLYIAEHCLKIKDLNMCWELCSYLVDENYEPSWKCCWALINKNSMYINETILSFISLHCDEILLDDVLKKSLFIRDESIPNEEYRITSTYSFYSNSFYDRDYSQQMEFKELPLLKSPPTDEKSAIKYVNIDTPLFIMVYLASNTKNDILIEKDNEYALQLSIYCQSLMRTSPPRNLNAIPSSIIDKTLVENNENYNRMIENRQYTILYQLDNSIDINRFKTDNEYRRLTILGLFMCDNPSFEYAEQLAIKYDISIDECHHTYFEYLLTNSNLSLNEIRKKIKPFLNSERMKKNRQIKLDFVKRLHSNVFPLIDGKDYERLKLFYDIKKSLGDSTHAQRHIQAIQQLTTILNYDFDYKLFLSSPEKFLEKYSNDSNLINLGLALDQIKVLSSLIITSSWIYSYYLRYNPSSSLTFDLLNRITTYEDFYLVITHLVTLRNILSIKKRIEIIEFSIKLIQSKDDEQWKSLEEFLNEQFLRLKTLSKLSRDYSQDELNQLDQCENVQQQENILSNILSQHGQFDLIIYLKKRIFDQISINQILKLTIEKISQNLKSNDDNRLDHFLESISLNDIDQKELFSCLQHLCRTETIDRRVRFKLIDKLDKMFDKKGLQSDDLLLFEQYRLSNLLSSFDSFNEIKKEEIETDDKRCQLFQKYLSQATRIIHFESLIPILNNTWSKQQINNMKGSHGLTLKNELILTMIEKNSEWERVLTENIIRFDEQEMSSLIEYLYNSQDLISYAYKLWLINPISSLGDLLFRSPSELVIDKNFLVMSIKKHRINDLLTINPLLFDYYLNENLSKEEKSEVLKQLENNEELLLKLGQLFVHKENYSSFLSFALIVDTLQKYFLNK